MIKQLLSGSVLRVTALLITSIIAFFMMPFLIHNLGDRYYGLWVIIGAIASYYGIFSWGIISALDRFISKYHAEGDYEGVNKVASTSFIIFSIMGVIVFVLSLISTQFCGVFLTDVKEIVIFEKLLIIIGLCLMIQFPTGVFSGILTALLRYDLVAVTEIIKAIVRGSLIVLAVTNDYGLPALALVLLIAETLTTLLQLYLVKTRFPEITFQFDSTKIKMLLGYGGVSTIAGVAETLRVRLIPMLVAALQGVELVVIYSIALRLMEYFQQFIRNAIGMMVPIFSKFESDKEAVKKVFDLSLMASIVMTLFVGYSVLLYSKPFITLWVGAEYSSSYTIVIILTLPFVVILTQTPIKELFYGMSKQKYCVYVYTAEIALFALFSVVFSKIYGIYGIAFGFLAGVVLPELVIFPIMASKILKVKALSIYYTMLTTTLKTTVPFGIFYILYSMHIPSSYIEILTFGVIQSIIFLVALYFLILPTELKGLIELKLRQNLRRYKQKCYEHC